jgi:hypothetical protein
MMRALRLVPGLLLFALPARAQQPCQLVGVWDRVSSKVDGVPDPAGTHFRKIITRNHFMWVMRLDHGLKDLKTAADSLRAFASRAGSTGTYTVQGNTYTERLESFPEPVYEGLSLPFTCRVEGDTFYQSGNFPIIRDGKKVRDVKLEEVYRRIG